MRVTSLTAGFLLAGAAISMTAIINPALASQGGRIDCPCNCPDDYKVKPHHAMAAPAVHRPPHRVARRAYRYDYAAAGAMGGEWHGPWRVAPDDMILPYTQLPPSYQAAAYGPPPQGYGGYGGYSAVQIDPRGLTGGVGADAAGGGGGGGFTDGYGQVHFSNGGGEENGPTYNSYSQSFQYNPSVPAPFQNRLMGGLAPAASSK